MPVNYNLSYHRRENCLLYVVWNTPNNSGFENLTGLQPYFNLFDDLNTIVLQANSANGQIILSAYNIGLLIPTTTLITIPPKTYSYNFILDGPNTTYELLVGLFTLRY